MKYVNKLHIHIHVYALLNAGLLIFKIVWVVLMRRKVQVTSFNVAYVRNRNVSKK